MLACYINLWVLILGISFIILEYSALRNFKFIFMVIVVFGITCFSTYIDWHFNLISSEIGKELIINLICLISLIILSILYYIKRANLEIILLSSIMIVGVLAVVLTDNLIVIYLGIEVSIVSFFILITTDKHSTKSVEVGMKYFIISSLSSGMFLLGLALMFTYNVVLDLNALIPLGTHNSLHLRVCYSLIVLALLLKLAIFPLHFWMTEVYEGGTWEMFRILTILPILTILAVLIHLVSIMPITLPVGLLFVVVSTFGVLNQTQLKRLVDYNGVSHLGFILIGLSFATREGLEGSILYLIIYVFTISSLFLLVKMSTFTKEYLLIELNNVFIRNWVLALIWIFLLFSIVCIPPLAGFIGKWLSLRMSLTAKYMLLACFVLKICSAVGVGYYLRNTKFIILLRSKTLSQFWSAVMHPFTMISYPLIYLLGLGVYLSLFLIFNIKCLTILLYISTNYII